MSLDNDIKSILSLIDSYKSGRYEFLHEDFDEFNDLKVLQLLKLSEVYFPNFDTSMWKKCLSSVKALIEDQYREMAELSISSSNKGDQVEFVQEILASIVDDGAFTNELNILPIHDVLKNHWSIYGTEILEGMKRWGIDFEFDQNSFSCSLRSRSAYISQSVSESMEKGIEDSIDLLLINTRPTRTYPNFRWVESNVTTKLNSLELRDQHFLLIIMLKSLALYVGNKDVQHLIEALSVGLESSCLDPIELNVTLDHNQVAADKKSISLSSSGGTAKSRKYDKAKEQIAQLLMRDHKKYKDYSEAAVYIRQHLKGWQRDQIKQGWSEEDVPIYKEGPLRKKWIPTIMNDLALSFD